MSIESWLSGLEKFESSLYTQLELFRAHTEKEARTAKSVRYISLYLVTILSSLSTLVRAMIHSVKTFILYQLNHHTDRITEVKRQTHNTGSMLRPLLVHSVVDIEAIIELRNDASTKSSYALKDGETLISTASYTLPHAAGVELIELPESKFVTPLVIQIRTNKGQVERSKLIFQSAKKIGLKLYRRFGTDEVPVKLNESFNLSTDRIVIGDISVRFSTCLRHASSLQSY